jgi:hypothetical protein
MASSNAWGGRKLLLAGSNLKPAAGAACKLMGAAKADKNDKLQQWGGWGGYSPYGPPGGGWGGAPWGGGEWCYVAYIHETAWCIEVCCG